MISITRESAANGSITYGVKNTEGKIVAWFSDPEVARFVAIFLPALRQMRAEDVEYHDVMMQLQMDDWKDWPLVHAACVILHEAGMSGDDICRVLSQNWDIAKILTKNDIPPRPRTEGRAAGLIQELMETDEKKQQDSLL